MGLFAYLCKKKRDAEIFAWSQKPGQPLIAVGFGASDGQPNLLMLDEFVNLLSKPGVHLWTVALRLHSASAVQEVSLHPNFDLSGVANCDTFARKLRLQVARTAFSFAGDTSAHVGPGVAFHSQPSCVINKSEERKEAHDRAAIGGMRHPLRNQSTQVG